MAKTKHSSIYLLEVGGWFRNYITIDPETKALKFIPHEPFTRVGKYLVLQLEDRHAMTSLN